MNGWSCACMHADVGMDVYVYTMFGRDVGSNSGIG